MSLTEDKGVQLNGQACKAHDYDLMKPVVLASWKHGFQGSWSDKSAVLAESQVNLIISTILFKCISNLLLLLI